MLKFLLWSLIFANVVLFAYERGYLGAWISDGHEPTRSAQQFNADKMKPLSASAIAAASVADAAPAADVAPAAMKPEESSCTEIGSFDAATAKRFEAQLLPLALGDKVSRHDIQEAARNMVYIPSQGSKEAADKKASELRNLGVHDFYIIQDAGDLHWGISLGIFKTEDSARAQLAALSLKGVHSARLGIRNATSNKVAFQLRNLDAKATSSLDKIKLAFPHLEAHSCESTPVSAPVSASIPTPVPLADSQSTAHVAKQTFPRDMTH